VKNGFFRLSLALAFSSASMLAGCGGGGGGGSLQSAGAPLLPPIGNTPAPQPAAGGPVAYLQNSGPLKSSGSISDGEQQAIVAVMSGSTGTNGTFSLDNLTVTAASGPAASNSRAASFTVRRSVPRPALVSPEAFAADDSDLLNKLNAHRTFGGASTEGARTLSSTIPSAAALGSTASIWVQQGASSTGATQVPATLVAQSAHGNIWLDNTLLNTAAATNASQIASDFENAYASDTAHFASPDYSPAAPGLQAQYQSCDNTGSVQGSAPAYITEPAGRRINVMVVNPDRLGGFGGYFSGSNLMTQSALNCLNAGASNYKSNEAPFIFVGWFSSQSATYELQEDLVRGTAHELQHLINFVNHSILASGAAKAGFSGSESIYINEGLSMLAQDLAVARMYASQGVDFDADDALSRANAYLANPGSFSISDFIGVDGFAYGGGGNAQYNCFGGCYGGAYLFQRYLHDRFGGDGYTRAMETSGVVGSANLQAATGKSSGDLLDDFALAMAASTLGVHAAAPRFSFGTLGLTRSYPDQFGDSKTLGGLYANPLGGGSISVQAPVGGFTFVAVSSVPSGGLPVTVTDRASVSGFGLAGGLAQH
jgi:hypothetical protein